MEWSVGFFLGGGRRASRALLLNLPQVCKDLLGAIKGLDIVVIKIILTFSTIIEAQTTRATCSVGDRLVPVSLSVPQYFLHGVRILVVDCDNHMTSQMALPLQSSYTCT